MGRWRGNQFVLELYDLKQVDLRHNLPLKFVILYDKYKQKPTTLLYPFTPNTYTTGTLINSFSLSNPFQYMN